MAKRYYWLKLKDDFFNKREVKKLRKIAGGDTFTIIYLKLLLLSIKNEGKIFYEGVENTFAEEMALELDENIENVSLTLTFLQSQNLIEEVEFDEFLLPEAMKSIGSETDSASRVRKHRNSQKLLQSNDGVTEGNTEIERDKDKEIELERDRELDNSISKDILVPKDLVPIQESWNSLGLSKINSIKGNRLKLLNARVKEYGIDTILKAIEEIKKSSFLMGQNRKSWVIVFDWFIKPNNFPKVLEGNYTDKEGNYGNNKGSNTENTTDYKGIKRQADIHAPGPTAEELRRAEEEGLFD